MKQTDCNGNYFPIFTIATVNKCEVVTDAIPSGSVWLLEIALAKNEPHPCAGQFYMLRSERSNTMLARPISVFHTSNSAVQFLILKKGQGTSELCSLRAGDKIQVLGPLGNGFEVFAPNANSSSSENESTSCISSKHDFRTANKAFDSYSERVCLVGGGIGVAPVAGFAETLMPESYDFFASFKSGSYGLNYIKPATLTITTDDGSVGVHGMLPSALTADVLRERCYSVVYACGPLPMLRYVKKICAEAGVRCYISMESRMACGMGACLGCTINTIDGYKRCCKDGPVFDANILQFEETSISSNKQNSVIEKKTFISKQNYATEKKSSTSQKIDIDLSVNISGVRLENPVIAASGTFGYGTEYKSIFDVNTLGGIASKGLTLEARQGNSGVRIWETPSGIINSIGLQNPGIAHFIENELPQMLSLKPVTLVNLSGSTLDTYVEGARLLEETAAPIIELNISCPNVLDGGAIWGCDCIKAATVVSAVRSVTKKPLVVKLTPQATDLSSVVLSCIEAGADAISLCNTFSAVAIDIERGVLVFDNVKAGLSGPAVRPIAVRIVYDTVATINKLPSEKQVPVIAIGGIATWQDTVEFIMAGATAIEVGAATFLNPLAMCQIIDGLRDFMKRKCYSCIDEMRGIAQR